MLYDDSHGAWCWTCALSCPSPRSPTSRWLARGSRRSLAGRERESGFDASSCRRAHFSRPRPTEDARGTHPPRGPHPSTPTRTRAPCRPRFRQGTEAIAIPTARTSHQTQGPTSEGRPSCSCPVSESLAPGPGHSTRVVPLRRAACLLAPGTPTAASLRALPCRRPSRPAPLRDTSSSWPCSTFAKGRTSWATSASPTRRARW